MCIANLGVGQQCYGKIRLAQSQHHVIISAGNMNPDTGIRATNIVYLADHKSQRYRQSLLSCFY